MAAGRRGRDVLLGIGGAITAIGLAALGTAVLLRLIDGIRIGFVPTTYTVGRGVDLAHYVVLGCAFAIACIAFVGSPSTRERRLKVAAIIAACAFAASVVAQCLYAAAYTEHKIWTQLVVSESLGALGALLSLAAVAGAALAFHRASAADPSDQSRRDGVLAWSAAGLAIGLVLTTASAVLYADGVEISKLADAGIWLAVAGSAVGIFTGVVAAIALFASRRNQLRSDQRWVPKREALLSIALGIFFIAMALQGIGAATTASGLSDAYAFTGLETAYYWVAAGSALIICAGAACAAIGFLYSAVSVSEAASSKV